MFDFDEAVAAKKREIALLNEWGRWFKRYKVVLRGSRPVEWCNFRVLSVGSST